MEMNEEEIKQKEIFYIAVAQISKNSLFLEVLKESAIAVQKSKLVLGRSNLWAFIDYFTENIVELKTQSLQEKYNYLLKEQGKNFFYHFDTYGEANECFRKIDQSK